MGHQLYCSGRNGQLEHTNPTRLFLLPDVIFFSGVAENQCYHAILQRLEYPWNMAHNTMYFLFF